jgi:hypothetical protein
MIRRVALERTDISEERISSIIRVTGIGELGKTLAVTSSRSTQRRSARSPIFIILMMEAINSSVPYVLRRATRRHNPDYAILHSHRRENFKPYKFSLIYIYL